MTKAREHWLAGLLPSPLMNDPSQPPRPHDVASPREDHVEILRSLAFWGCLLLAVGTYSLVVLSPKVVRWSRRADEFTLNQQKLLLLRQQIEYAERLAHEWEANGTFATSVHTSDHDGQLATGTSIVVEEGLRYHGFPQESKSVSGSPSASLGLRGMQFVSRSLFVQIAGLVGGAVLLLFAFTRFVGGSPSHDAIERRPVPSRGGFGRYLLRNRYRLPTDSIPSGAVRE